MSALVLIVDPDPERLRSAQRSLQWEGAVVATATGARAAMLLFVRREPQVTLLHVDSSGDCGLGLCRDMKSLRTGRRRAVVIVGPRGLRAAAFESGCDAFVIQGTDSRPVQRAVDRLLAASRVSVVA